MPTEEQYRDYRTYEKALDPTIAGYLYEIQRLFPSFPRKAGLEIYKKPNTEWPPQICTCNADQDVSNPGYVVYNIYGKTPLLISIKNTTIFVLCVLLRP